MYEDFLIEETVGEQPKRAVVMVGRLNPPTAAHLKVIDLMKKYARTTKGVEPVVVIVNGEKTSKDKSKNPLSVEDRIKFLNASGKANGVKILSAGSAFAAFEEVRKAGFEPYAIAAGSDRAKGYKEMLDKYYTSSEGKTLHHEVMSGLAEREDPEDDGVPSEEVLKLAEKGEDIPTHLISGSMAREAVKQNLPKAFEKIVGLPEKLSKMMFDKIRAVQPTEKEE